MRSTSVGFVLSSPRSSSTVVRARSLWMIPLIFFLCCACCGGCLPLPSLFGRDLPLQPQDCWRESTDDPLLLLVSLSIGELSKDEEEDGVAAGGSCQERVLV